MAFPSLNSLPHQEIWSTTIIISFSSIHNVLFTKYIFWAFIFNEMQKCFKLESFVEFLSYWKKNFWLLRHLCKARFLLLFLSSNSISFKYWKHFPLRFFHCRVYREPSFHFYKIVTPCDSFLFSRTSKIMWFIQFVEKNGSSMWRRLGIFCIVVNLYCLM